MTESYTYNAAGQVAAYRTQAPGYDVTYYYSYDDNGNILSITDGSWFKSYAYDSQGQLSLVELHDCFTITEIVLYEDLLLSKRGEGWKDALEGKFTKDGKLPVNIDGGLKAFGHPIGASGIRMMYESWLQFHSKAGERQLENPKLGLAHNLGGYPWENVSAIAIVGKELG